MLFLRSDYDAWANLVQPQSYADNYTQAAAMGINAGMDQEVSPCAFETSVTMQSPAGDSLGRTPPSSGALCWPDDRLAGATTGWRHEGD